MSMLDWILGAEAIGATGIALKMIVVAEARRIQGEKWDAQARFWRAVSKRLARRLDDEREANFLFTRLHRPSASADAQETTHAG